MGKNLREKIGTFEHDNLVADTSFPLQVGAVKVADGQGTLLRGTVLGLNAAGTMYEVANKTKNVPGSVILAETLETAALEAEAPVTTTNAVVYVSGPFNRFSLIVGGEDTVDTHEATLKTNGIYLKSVL